MKKNLDGKRFLLEDRDENRWLFFLSSNNRIQYYKLEDENKIQINTVDSQPVRDFYVSIDENGTIRIFAYTVARQLVYYEWANSRWERQVLDRIYSRFQNISYISILSASNNIHILYYVESSLIKSAEFLVHYYLQDGKWYGGPLWKFISDEATTLQASFLDPKDNIHIILTKRNKKGSQTLFHACFRSNSLSWTGPSPIHTSYGRCSQFQMFVDHNENIYVAWVENIDDVNRLKYLYQMKDDPSSAWNEAILYQSPQQISWPTFIQGDELLCIWQENNTLYEIKSLDSGRSWSQAYPVEHQDHLSLLYFISYNKHKIPFHSTNIWAHGYPNIKLAGVYEAKTKKSPYLKQSLESDYNSKLEKIRSSVSLMIEELNKEIKRNKNQIANLSSQIDQIYSVLYELQEQFKLKERALFAIQTEIKRLGFDIRRISQRSRPSPSFSVSSANEQVVPQESDADIQKDILPDPQSDARADTQSDAQPDTQSHAEASAKSSTQSDAKASAPSDIQPSDKEDNETKSQGPEKIVLGNTTILINPDDDLDDF